jgi:hypothetical protein
MNHTCRKSWSLALLLFSVSLTIEIFSLRQALRLSPLARPLWLSTETQPTVAGLSVLVEHAGPRLGVIFDQC